MISNLENVKFPDCGVESNKVHSRYKKSFQDLPIQGKKVIIIIKNRNMFCINQDCKRYTFSEKFSFIDSKAKKTIRIDKNSVEYVCIDDFAIKKRHSYGTVMIDAVTSCIVDLIDSRDTNDVSEWLKEYPNIKLVIRDGSISYRAAIKTAHLNAVHVNDRFHIVKNLVKAITKALQRIIIGRIEIPLTTNEAKLRHGYLMSLTRREKIIEAKRLRTNGISYKKNRITITS